MTVADITVFGRLPAGTSITWRFPHARIRHRRIRLIGSAVVPELLGAGHQVTGLARSDASAAALAAAGAQVQRGTLDDPGILREAAAASDGVIHLAFRHYIAFSGDFQGAGDSDRRAVETIGEALAGSGLPFVIAATLPPTPGRVRPNGICLRPLGVRRRPAVPDGHRAVGARPRLPRRPVLRRAAAPDGARRRRCLVHGDPGRYRPRQGRVQLLGDGSNRWPAVHRLDAAHLFRLALSRPPRAPCCTRSTTSVPIRLIAEVIGKHLGVPVAAISAEDAAGQFGWLAGVLAADIPASSALTRELLGWQPAQPGLIDDLDKGHYFRGPSA